MLFRSINEFAKAVGDDSLSVEIDETGAISVSDLRQVGTRVVDVLFDCNTDIDLDVAMIYVDAFSYMNGWIDGSNFERDIELPPINSNEDQTQPDDDGPNDEE